MPLHHSHVPFFYFLFHWILEKFILDRQLLFLYAGQRFAMREGGRTVGAGVVSKVIS